MTKGSVERLVSAWKAGVSDILDRLEDPSRMVRQTVRDMEGAVERAVQAAAGAAANLRRLQQRQAELRAQAQRWEQRAEACLVQGRDEGARAALARGAEVGLELEAVSAAVAESRAAADQLRTHAHDLRRRLQEARLRQGSVAARLQAEQAAAGPAAADEGELEPFLRFERLADQARAREAELARFAGKVEATVAEAEVYEELEQSGLADRRARRAETEARVEAELAELRRRLRPGGE